MQGYLGIARFILKVWVTGTPILGVWYREEMTTQLSRLRALGPLVKPQGNLLEVGEPLLSPWRAWDHEIVLKQRSPEQTLTLQLDQPRLEPLTALLSSTCVAPNTFSLSRDSVCSARGYQHPRHRVAEDQVGATRLEHHSSPIQDGCHQLQK